MLLALIELKDAIALKTLIVLSYHHNQKRSTPYQAGFLTKSSRQISMPKMKKTFGTHIEDGLTFMGNGIHRAVMEAKDHELESIKLGLISDEEKLRMLKRDLYEAARSRANPEHIQNLRTAISFAGARLGNRHNQPTTRNRP